MARLKVTPVKVKVKKSNSRTRKKQRESTRKAKKKETAQLSKESSSSWSGVRHSTRSIVVSAIGVETGERRAERAKVSSTTEKESESPKKKNIRKGIKHRKQDGASILPPDFRTASLLASSAISTGKMFGPFSGKIIEKKRPPSNKHSFVCSVHNESFKMFHFYVHDNDKSRCQWLKLVQSPPAGMAPNVVAYNSEEGVCYRAVKDINPGEEILASFEEGIPDATTAVIRENDQHVAFEDTSEVPQCDSQDSEDMVETEAVVDDETADQGNTEESRAVGETGEVIGEPSADRQEVACSTCKVNFETQDLLDIHVSMKVCKKLACEDCERDFYSPQAFKKHKRLYHSPERCKTCMIDFSNRKEYLRHCKSMHPRGMKRKQCPICKKIFSASYINDHIQSHDSGAFKCNVCGKAFSAKGNLQKHKFRHLPGYKPERDRRAVDRRFRCNACGKLFGGANALEMHSRIHTGERPYSCSECAMRFRQISHLNRHLRITHAKGNDNKNFKCTTCSRGYSSQKTLNLHVLTIHKGHRPFQCTLCQSTFIQRGNLFRHQREVHGKGSNLPTDECHFVCKEADCSKRFGTQAELNEHIMSHTGVHPFQCVQCGSNFSSKGNLRKHVRRKHLGEVVDCHRPGTKNITCPTCDKAFYTISQLREHSRVHTGEKISCGKCGQSFSQNSGLRKHLRCLRCPAICEEMRSRGEDVSSSVYPKSRKWQCEVCRKCFTGPSDLQSHGRVHTGERPFACDLCSRAFSQPGNLKKHMKYVHEGAKRPKDKPRPRRYDCSLCGKAFLSSGDLSMHCRVHSGNKPFRCERCDMAFSQRGNLKKHTERWHSDKQPKRWRQAEKLKIHKQNKSGDHETYTKPFNADSRRKGESGESKGTVVSDTKAGKQSELVLEPLSNTQTPLLSASQFSLPHSGTVTCPMTSALSKGPSSNVAYDSSVDVVLAPAAQTSTGIPPYKTHSPLASLISHFGAQVVQSEDRSKSIASSPPSSVVYEGQNRSELSTECQLTVPISGDSVNNTTQAMAALSSTQTLVYLNDSLTPGKSPLLSYVHIKPKSSAGDRVQAKITESPLSSLSVHAQIEELRRQINQSSIGMLGLAPVVINKPPSPSSYCKEPDLHTTGQVSSVTGENTGLYPNASQQAKVAAESESIIATCQSSGTSINPVFTPSDLGVDPEFTVTSALVSTRSDTVFSTGLRNAPMPQTVASTDKRPVGSVQSVSCPVVTPVISGDKTIQLTATQLQGLPLSRLVETTERADQDALSHVSRPSMSVVSRSGSVASSGVVSLSSVSNVISYEHPYCSDTVSVTHVPLIPQNSNRAVRGLPVTGGSWIAVRDPNFLRPSLTTLWASPSPAVLGSSFTSVVPISNVLAFASGTQPLYITHPLPELNSDLLLPHEPSTNISVTPDPSRLAQFVLRQPTASGITEILNRQRPHVVISPQNVFPRLSVVPANDSTSPQVAATSLYPLSLVSPEVIHPGTTTVTEVSSYSGSTSITGSSGRLITPVITQSALCRQSEKHATATTAVHSQGGSKTQALTSAVAASSAYVHFPLDVSEKNVFGHSSVNRNVQSLPDNCSGFTFGSSSEARLSLERSRTAPMQTISGHQAQAAMVSSLYQTPLNSVIVPNQSGQFSEKESERTVVSSSSVFLPEIHNLLKSAATSGVEMSTASESRPLLTFSSAFGAE